MRGINHHEDWSWSNAPRKGSSGQNTVVQQSGPPQQILNELQQGYNQGSNVSQQPYPTYGSSLLAGFTPQQTAGFGNINTAVNSSQPFLNAASQDATNATGLLDPSNFGGNVGAYQNQGLAPYLGQAGNQVNAALNYSQGAATNLNGANFGQTIGGYYNPYAQSVIAPTEAQFANTNAQQLNQVRGNAAAQGAFGGDREAVAEAQTAGQQQTAEAPVIAGLESSGYQQAVSNAMQAEQQQQQTAQTLMGAAGQTAAQGNLQQQGFNAATSAAQADAWLNSQGSFAMGNLGQETETLGLTGANAQIGAGQLQQQQAQQELNIPYQQFQAAQGYPYQMTNFLEGLATGTAGLSGSQGSTTSPGPSIASQIGGLGLTGIGAYGLLNNAGLLGGMGGAAGAGAGALSTASLSSLIDAGGGLGALGSAGAIGGDLAAFGARGGRIDHDKLRALHSLRRDIVMPRRVSGGGMMPADRNREERDYEQQAPWGQRLRYSRPATDSGDPRMEIKPPDTWTPPPNEGMRGGGRLPRRYTGGDMASLPTLTQDPTRFDNPRWSPPRVSPHIDRSQSSRIPGDSLQLNDRRLEVQPELPGGQEDYPQRTANGGIVPRRDVGGPVGPMMNPGAPIGSPMASNLYSQYASLPTEKLQELAVRAPQNPMIQRAIQMRRMTPQADPSQQPQQAQPGLGAPQQPQPQQMQAAPGGFGDGGEIERDIGGSIPDDYTDIPGMALTRAYGLSPTAAAVPTMQPISDQNTGSWQDSAPALGQTAGVGPPPPSSEGSGYADFRPAAGFGPQNYPMPSTGVPPPAPHHVAHASQVSHASQQPQQTVGGLGPQPPQDTTQMATHTQDAGGDHAGTPSHTSNFMTTPSGMLLAMGLGILGGKSPFASVNIGEGGLEGLKVGEQAQERQMQMENNNLYRSALINNRGQQLDINRDRQGTNQQRADTGALAQQARQRAQELQGQVSTGRLSLAQAQAQFNDEYKGLNFDFQQQKAGVASAQRSRQLDQADTRLQQSQANAQAALVIRRQALQQTQDSHERDAIQRATNSDIHAAASLAGSTGIPYAKALKQIQEGRGSSEAGNGVAPGTTTGTTANPQRPPITSLLPP